MMNNWLVVHKYDDGRIFIKEQTCAKDAEAMSVRMLQEHGSTGLIVFLTEIHFADCRY